MADSPGKVLFSFTSSDKRKCTSTKLRGCADTFFQLLDRFNHKKLFSYRLLPPERLEHNTISHTEEKLPMAKLLLIADENRVGPPKIEDDFVSDNACQKNEDCKERKEKKPIGVVARLMGLETMPSPEPFREKKHYEVSGNAKEAQCSRKLLQSGPVLTKEGGKREKSFSKRTKPPHRDQTHRAKAKLPESSPIDKFCELKAKLPVLNSVAGAPKQSTTKTSSNCCIVLQSFETDTDMQLIEVEDPFLNKLPPMPSFQVESPLRSILSPSRLTSSKVLSPIKSPLSSKKTVCLFGAAAKILEPNLRPARQRALYPHSTKRLPHGSASEDMNEQKMTMVGASFAPPLAKAAAESRIPAEKQLLNLEGGGHLSGSPSTVRECKGQVRSRLVNPSRERRAQFSSNEVNSLKHFISKQEQVKTSLHVKHQMESDSKPVSEKKMATSSTQKQKASSFTHDGGRLKPWQKCNKSLVKASQLNSKQNSAASPVNVKEEIVDQDEASKRSSRLVISRRQGFSSLGRRSAIGSSISTVSHPSRTALQDSKKSMKAPPELVNQEGSGRCLKASSQNVDKVMSSSKTITTACQSKIIKSAQAKGSSLSTRPSAKRKASSYIVKSLVQVDVITAEVKDFIFDCPSEGLAESYGKISACISDEQSDSLQSDLNASRVCSLDANNATSSCDTESVVHTRVRAKWDIGDERQRNITKNCISCQISDLPLAHCHPGNNDLRTEYALQTPETATGILEEFLFSLNTSTPQLYQDGSGGFFNEKKGLCRDSMDISATSSTTLNCLLQEAEQIQQSCDSFPLKEDTLITDTESVSDSLCEEEFEQPSPISTLESPFQDSASSCSESCDTSHGRTQSRVNATELLDYANSTGRQLEDQKFHGTQSIPDCNKFMDITSCMHCISLGSIEGNGTIDTMTEKDTLEPAAFSAIWERFFLFGPLLDSACFNQLEREVQYMLWRSIIKSKSSMEDSCGVVSCKERLCKRFTGHRRGESLLQQRDLQFDGIEEAVRLQMELAEQSYGFWALHMQQLPVAYRLKEAYKQVDEWKGLAVSMNLDDMMTTEINTGMGRWFKCGDEVVRLAENIEAMIVRSLMDELVEVVIGTSA